MNRWGMEYNSGRNRVRTYFVFLLLVPWFSKLRKCMATLASYFLEMRGTTSGTYSLWENSLTKKTQRLPETVRCLKRYWYICIVDFLIWAQQVRESMMKKAPLPDSPWMRVQHSFGCWFQMCFCKCSSFRSNLLLGFSSEVISKYLW